MNLHPPNLGGLKRKTSENALAKPETRTTDFGEKTTAISEGTVSNAELSQFFTAHQVPGRELSEFLSAYDLCAKANLPTFFAELAEFAEELSKFSLPKQCSRKSVPPVS